MQRTTIRRQLVLELYAYPPDVPMGLNGSGLLVINPPWQFDVHAAQILDYLQPILQHPDSPPIAKDARIQVRWLVGE
nr:23S rRNA (adenine(2030)-N(6))-methyltransferase RlmJ [Moraxella atlantae]